MRYLVITKSKKIEGQKAFDILYALKDVNDLTGAKCYLDGVRIPLWSMLLFLAKGE